jgi:predicted RNA binding protein YcfA (HicA-like mRNA interferase family)
MKSLKCREWEKIVKQHGWHLERVTGSHHIYKKHGEIACLSIPIHAGEDMKLGLLRHQMKVAGIKESDF